MNQLDPNIQRTVTEINQELKSLSTMSQADKERKNEDIKSMILYFVDGSAKMEDRRTKVSDLSWQAFGLIIAALGIIVAVSTIPLWKIPIFITLFVMLFFSIAKLIEYGTQSNFRFIFLDFPEFGNRWKWFYYGNEHIIKINKNPFNLNPTRVKKDQISYLEGLKLFLGNYHHETIDKEISDNLIQLYLLQVHNFYKNRFYLRLIEYNKWTLWSIAALLIIYIIFVVISAIFFPAIMSYLIN
jgi:hypothetical protein